VAVICASGQRAVVGASLLQRHGFGDVLHVAGGGFPLWARRGFPVED
jgi:rhodanese-related sulfurtransferase